MQNALAGSSETHQGISSFGLFGFIAFGIGMVALSFVSIEAGKLVGTLVGL